MRNIILLMITTALAYPLAALETDKSFGTPEAYLASPDFQPASALTPADLKALVQTADL
jgi:hypothetical protein